MTINDNNGSTLQRPIRLWPGVAIVLVQWLARFGIPLVAPDSTAIGLMSGIFGGLAIVIWWALLSRAPWSERLGAIGLMAVALAATVRLVDESIVTGMMGFMFWVYAIPTLSLAFVIGVAVSRHLPRGPRLAAMAAAILIGSGGWALFQTGGFGSDVNHDFAWRWAQTPEDRLVAQANENPPVLSSVAATESEPEWPGFRGPERDGITRGARIETDWSSSPPVELWRREIGPGWSSFSVHGNVFYTQEQRGDDEMVMCYNITTGEPIWQHGDATRFWESNGGAGPRGTPTLANGRVYTFGGTGILNVLDARDGSVVWMRNAETDTKAKLPIWGYSSSPLLVDDLVIVAVSSALIAYDRSDGSPRWTISADGDGYGSPHLLEIDGVSQVVHLRRTGIIGVSALDGKQLWEHLWRGYPIVQPAMTADGDILVSVSEKSGTRRLTIAQGSDGWTVKERWTTNRLKPYSSDFAVHNGHAYGFDGNIFACIDLADGAGKWKGGRYGLGQLVLLADQDVFLVLTEKGEITLVKAAPDAFTELARMAAVKGKTWNHPVLVGNLLLVRNAREMVAFRLPLAGH